MSVNKHFDEKVDITSDEFEKLSQAIKKEEFRKLFLDYCEEIQDPENRKLYEAEIKKLEAQRGVEVTFLNPDPGFVVKTSVDGSTKCFLNIAKCDKVAAPSSKPSISPKDATKGVSWSIPHGLPPPRNDYDNNKRRCQVFDVIFHPDALSLAEKNAAFRRCLIQTACDGVEREYKVRLDRTNLKFPKLKYKGVPHGSIIRKLMENPPKPSEEEPGPLDNILPPMPLANNGQTAKTLPITTDEEHDEYCTPKYVLKYRRPMDMSEMTYEMDAKINVTVPKELCIEIELPLLKSAANCTLDVTDKMLYLVSEKPAKYKLNIELPYAVNDKDGSAKFDSDKRKLLITLPVKTLNKERRMRDLYRDDSGVESDIRDELQLSDENTPVKSLEDELDLNLSLSEEPQQTQTSIVLKNPTFFLKNSIEYTFPQHFDLNVLDETIAIVLHVRNVDNDSIKLIKDCKNFHVQFTSIGAGYYPTHYAFYFEFLEESSVEIDCVDAEAWDNNVVLSLSLKNFKNIEYYHAGLDKANIKVFRIQEEFILGNSKQSKFEDNQSKLEVSVELSDDEKSVQIEIKPRQAKAFNFDEKEEYNESKTNSSRSVSKKHKKKNKKPRSFSESTCDDIKQHNKKTAAESTSKNKNTQRNDFKPSSDVNGCENIDKDNQNNVKVVSSAKGMNNGGGDGNIQIPINRKQRSFSESRNQSAPIFKGILKHSSRYSRNMSDSCSSIDEPSSYSCSIDCGLRFAHSFSDIPEENSSQQGLSESCKKTVRFNDVIKKNIFRLHSSILGRRKINQKKKNKKRALQRRHSEGDCADYEDNKSPNNNEQFLKRAGHDRKSSKHDSGLDLSTQGKPDSYSMRNRAESESSDVDSKNSLMFDIDI